jgi:hypothetical protein
MAWNIFKNYILFKWASSLADLLGLLLNWNEVSENENWLLQLELPTEMN